MSLQPFVHLHVHTHYSILDGQASVSALVDKAIEDKIAKAYEIVGEDTVKMGETYTFSVTVNEEMSSGAYVVLVNGKEVTNEVTYLVLEILEELGISDFPTTVRINKNTDEKLKRACEDMLLEGNVSNVNKNENLNQ